MFPQHLTINKKVFHLHRTYGSGSLHRARTEARRKKDTFQTLILADRTGKTVRYGLYLREIRKGEKYIRRELDT